MKILFLIKGLGLGGAERHLVDCALAFRERGHGVQVAYMLAHKDHFVAQLQAGGIEVTLVRNRLRDLLSLVRRADPDLVHAHLPVAAIFARLLKPIVGYKLVVTYHNVLQRQKPPIRIAERVTHGLEDAGISCSREVAHSMPWRTLVIPNGIRLDQGSAGADSGLRGRLGLKEGSIILVCVANLAAKKNHALLLRAFDRAVGTTGGDAHLVLIGQDASERGSLESLRSQLVNGKRVHFWGPDADAPALMGDADIFCLASDHEGLPLALLEAMSQGLPAIVTDAGGMPGAVRNGQTGIVVPRGDEEGYACAISAMLTNEELRTRMGDAARENVRLEFGFDRMLARIEQVYGDVMGSGDASD